jgi:ubiquinone biosynthesis protein
MLRSSSICATFLYNYLIVDKETKDKNGVNLDKNIKKLQCMADTLASYGGVLSKLSQILSLNDTDNKVFSDCKPFSKRGTIEYFDNFIQTQTLNLQEVDLNVYKSGSVGQVHRAKYKNRDIIFKVQYVGLAEQTITDLDMFDKITSYIYYFADMKQAMIDIRKTMFLELNYKFESFNQKRMYDIYKDIDFIEIPEIIDEFCTDTILGMYFVEGKSLPTFINNSTQEDRNKFGTSLVKFVFENIYKHGILYSDLHYGNFLVKDDCSLCVLDFGCLHDIDTTLLSNLRKLHMSIRLGDTDEFYTIVEDMGIIKKDISMESRKYIYDYFCIQYEPWTSEQFEFTQSWLDNSCQKNPDLMKEWVLPPDMIYFNKIPYGCYHIFTKLNLKGCFREIFDNMLS